MSIIKGKVVLVGDTSVGKTAIVNCFNKLSIDVSPTVGANSITCNVKLESTGEEVTLNIWDTAGQDDFKCLVPMYARCAQVALVVFDQSNESSYETTEQWIQYMRDEVQVPNIFLIANKYDLDEKVDINKILAEAQTNNIQFHRTSAKTGFGIDILFQSIAEVVAQPDTVQPPTDEQVIFTPTPIDKTNHNQKKCC